MVPPTENKVRPGPIRVLLVDDEDVFRDTLAKVLRKRGINVAGAASGDECLTLLRARDFDVVVLDLKMPGIDGLETLHRIEAIRPAAKVVMLTGHGTVHAGLEAMKARAFDFLLKPVPADRLVEVIETAASAGEQRDSER